jgi:aminopeptidase N
MKFITGCLFILLSCFASAQIDVKHYRFEIELSDKSDAITGKATITVLFTADASQLNFDLASLEGEKGMIAFAVNENNQQLKTSQSYDKLVIYLAKPARKGEQHQYVVNYMGTPKDGLIISKNRYGDRTFFSDNWPNRAHNWIPCKDSLGDKATFEFIVTAPSQYRVVSNGVKVEETDLDNKTTRTHWKTDIALPTKVMVIGAAEFAVKVYPDSPPFIPVSAWVYHQDSAKGFYDYAVAPQILKFFSSYIAPYPYEKLANVQSKTIFGGMENASAIFYAEESVAGNRSYEEVLVHEIAHQWFGDMASESSFAHLWLSEGFATYFTDLYYEYTYGKEAAVKRLEKERRKVIAFMHSGSHAVVDSTSDLMSLLNANSYEKGGWVLHMLRQQVGDSIFHKIIQTYYQQYKGSNAQTRDFERIAESVSGKNLQSFFDQWLYTPGVPKLMVNWKADGNDIKISITQQQKYIYQFPLGILIATSNGKQEIHPVNVSSKLTEVKLNLKSKPVKLVLDPATNLLYEAEVSQSK